MSMREVPARNVSSAAEERRKGRVKNRTASKAMTQSGGHRGIGFMELFMIGLRWRNERKSYVDGGAEAVAAGDLKFSPQRHRPFPHACQTQGFGVRQLAIADAPAIVFDSHRQAARRLLQGNRKASRIGMPGNVSQGFLKDAEDGRAERRRQMVPFESGSQAALQVRSLLELSHLPLHGWHQAEIVQH